MELRLKCSFFIWIFITFIHASIQLSPPSYISPWILMDSDVQSTCSQVLSHGFGILPIKVDVQVMSPSTGFIYPGLNSAFAGNDNNDRGGVVYLYNENDVALYGATNDLTQGGTAYIIFTGMSYWSPDNQEKSKQGYVRVRAWHPNDLPAPSFTTVLDIKAGNVLLNDYEERSHGLGTPPVLTVVQYKRIGSLYGWTTEAQGSSSRPVNNANLYWGGLVYAVDSNDIRVWAPSSGQANYGAFSFCDGWGYDTRSQCSYLKAEVTISMWTDLDTASFFTETHSHNVGDGGVGHELSLLPALTIDVDNDIVTVAATAKDGANLGFTFYGTGAAAVDNDDGCGGVIYAYSNVTSSVRIWHAEEAASNIIHVVGMGGGTYNQQSKDAFIEIKLFKAASSTSNAASSTSNAPPSTSSVASSTSNAASSTSNAPPSTSSVASSTSNAASSTSNAPPSTSSVASSTSNAASSTSNAPPSTSNAASSTSNAPPSTSSVALSTSNAASSTSNAPPSTSNAASSTSNAASSTSNAPPSTSNAVSSTSNAASSTSNAPPSTSNAASSTSNAPPSTSSVASSTSNAASSTSNAPPSTSNAASSTSNAPPSTSNAASSTSNAPPSTSNAASSTSNAASSNSNAASSTSVMVPSSPAPLTTTTQESVVCFNTTITVNMTTVLNTAREIVANLTVLPKETSKYTRSLTSAKDKRQSSKVIGVAGAGVCVFVFTLMVIPDVFTFIHFLFARR